MTRNIKTIGAIAVLALLAGPLRAGVIIGGDYLDQAAADRLESWLGTGDLDFTNIWDGAPGDTPDSWHQAVDGVAKTVSIYEVVLHGNNLYPELSGTRMLVGGYNAGAWSSDASIASNMDNFMFNLTEDFKLVALEGHIHTGNHAVDFADFWLGLTNFTHDPWLGVVLGGSYGIPGIPYWKANIILGEYECRDRVPSDCSFVFDALGLETYTFAPARAVSEPALAGLMLLGLAGLGFSRRFANPATAGRR